MKKASNIAPCEFCSLNLETERTAYYKCLIQPFNRSVFMLSSINLLSFDSAQENNLIFDELNRFNQEDKNFSGLADEQTVTAASKLFKHAAVQEWRLAQSDSSIPALSIRESETLILDTAARLYPALETALSIEGAAHHLDPYVDTARCLPDGNTASEDLRSSDIVKLCAEDKQVEYCYSYKRLNGEVREYRIAQKLKEAAYEELFHLLYQPAVILDSNCFYGAKVLLGWSDSELGFVSHDEFIPIAEHLGVIPDIGQWLIKQSCLQLKKWNDAGTPLSGKLSINISIHQLKLKNFTHELLNNVLSEGALPIDIELDFTESFLLNDSKKVEEKFSELSMLGFGAAIDEFQTGYSTLAYLKTSSERTLKISRAYINSIFNNPCDKKLVKAIIENANRLGITTAAEGVETAEQAELVKELGCKLVQGQYYAEPCSVEQFILKMNSRCTI